MKNFIAFDPRAGAAPASDHRRVGVHEVCPHRHCYRLDLVVDGGPSLVAPVAAQEKAGR